MGRIAIDESNRFGSDLKPLCAPDDLVLAVCAKELFLSRTQHHDELHRLNLEHIVAYGMGTKSAEVVMRSRGRLFNMYDRTGQASNPQREQASILKDQR